MIYNAVTSWLEGKFNAFNSTLGEESRLKKIDVSLDTDFLPSGLKDKRYIIKFREIAEDATETTEYTAKITIEFQFQLFKRPLEYYKQITDDYLFRFIKLLQDDTIGGLEYESNGLILSNIRNLRVAGLNRLNKGGQYLLPLIEFDLVCNN
jgi:hypothetical protein